MATYNLEQQEQLDQVKHVWKKYGGLVTWTLVLCLVAYAGWTGYLFWQNDRAAKAGGLYEELDRAAMANDADRVTRVFGDLKDKYPGTTYTEQGALLAARIQLDRGKDEPARASLQWLVDHGKNEELVAIARLRLAGLMLDAKQFEPALKLLQAEVPVEFQALAHDRRGDIQSAMGKKDEALKSYQEAWKLMDASVEYRHFIGGKLTALGAPPEPSSLPTKPAGMPPGLAP